MKFLWLGWSFHKCDILETLPNLSLLVFYLEEGRCHSAVTRLLEVAVIVKNLQETSGTGGCPGPKWFIWICFKIRKHSSPKTLKIYYQNVYTIITWTQVPSKRFWLHKFLQPGVSKRKVARISGRTSNYAFGRDTSCWWRSNVLLTTGIHSGINITTLPGNFLSNLHFRAGRWHSLGWSQWMVSGMMFFLQEIDAVMINSV